MAARAVIGRDEELAAIEAFLADIEHGPGALVLSGEAGIGKTILWEAGVDEGRRGLRLRADLPRGRSRGIVVLRRALGAAGAGVRRGRRLAAAAAPTSAGGCPPARRARRRTAGYACDRSGGARCAACSGRARAGPGGARRPAVARSGVSGRRADRASPPARRAGPAARNRSDSARTWRVPSSSTASFPASQLEQLSLGPLSLGAVHTLLEERLGLELTRPGAGSRAGSDRRQPVLRARAGPRARPHEHEADAAAGHCRCPRACRSCSAAVWPACPTDTGDVLLQVAALARPTVELVAAAHGDRDRVLEALEAAEREGVVELDGLDGSVSRIRCSPRSATSRRRSGSDAPSTGRSPQSSPTSRSGHATSRSPPTAPDERVASELDAAAEHAAARGATCCRGRALRARRRADTRTILPWRRQRRLQAARFHRLAGDRDRARRCSSSCSREVPLGVERADVLLRARLCTLRGRHRGR